MEVVIRWKDLECSGREVGSEIEKRCKLIHNVLVGRLLLWKTEAQSLCQPLGVSMDVL